MKLFYVARTLRLIDAQDFQHFIVDRNVKDATSKLRPVVDFLHAWRKKGGKVMHIAVRFESGPSSCYLFS